MQQPQLHHPQAQQLVTSSTSYATPYPVLAPSATLISSYPLYHSHPSQQQHQPLFFTITPATVLVSASTTVPAAAVIETQEKEEEPTVNTRKTKRQRSKSRPNPRAPRPVRAECSASLSSPRPSPSCLSHDSSSSSSSSCSPSDSASDDSSSSSPSSSSSSLSSGSRRIRSLSLDVLRAPFPSPGVFDSSGKLLCYRCVVCGKEEGKHGGNHRVHEAYCKNRELLRRGYSPIHVTRRKKGETANTQTEETMTIDKETTSAASSSTSSASSQSDSGSSSSSNSSDSPTGSTQDSSCPPSSFLSLSDLKSMIPSPPHVTYYMDSRVNRRWSRTIYRCVVCGKENINKSMHATHEPFCKGKELQRREGKAVRRTPSHKRDRQAHSPAGSSWATSSMTAAEQIEYEQLVLKEMNALYADCDSALETCLLSRESILTRVDLLDVFCSEGFWQQFTPLQLNKLLNYLPEGDQQDVHARVQKIQQEIEQQHKQEQEEQRQEEQKQEEQKQPEQQTESKEDEGASNGNAADCLSSSASNPLLIAPFLDMFQSTCVDPFFCQSVFEYQQLLSTGSLDPALKSMRMMAMGKRRREHRSIVNQHGEQLPGEKKNLFQTYWGEQLSDIRVKGKGKNKKCMTFNPNNMFRDRYVHEYKDDDAQHADDKDSDVEADKSAPPHKHVHRHRSISKHVNGFKGYEPVLHRSFPMRSKRFPHINKVHFTVSKQKQIMKKQHRYKSQHRNDATDDHQPEQEQSPPSKEEVALSLLSGELLARALYLRPSLWTEKQFEEAAARVSAARSSRAKELEQDRIDKATEAEAQYQHILDTQTAWTKEHKEQWRRTYRRNREQKG